MSPSVATHIQICLQPATTRRRDSECKQTETSGDSESFHFMRLASVSLRYRAVKLKIFLGSLGYVEDQKELRVPGE